MNHKIFFPFSSNNDKQTPLLFDNVWDFGYIKNDKKFIDLSLGSCGCFPLGFTRQDFIKEVSNKLLTFPFISGDFKTTNDFTLELTNKFYEMTGYHSMFAVSGSDAVEAAIKMADLYHLSKGQDRKYKVGFEDSYHGSTYMSASISGSEYIHQTHGRHPNCITVPWDIEKVEEILDSRVSCIIIETCSWQAGLDLQTDEWWQRLKICCEKYDIVLIVDDIAFTGFKTGKFFGYKEFIKPDIVCFGKAVTAGYFPLSGCLISSKIKSYIEDLIFLHGFSYSFNMSGILSSLHYLHVNENEGIGYQHDIVKKRYSEIFNLPGIKSVKSHGLMFCLDINFNNQTEHEIAKMFFDQGLYLGLWNSKLNKNKLLIHCPAVYNDLYAEKLELSLSNILK
jgi:beta-alanine--pyruvate transaminase